MRLDTGFHLCMPETLQIRSGRQQHQERTCKEFTQIHQLEHAQVYLVNPYAAGKHVYILYHRHG